MTRQFYASLRRIVNDVDLHRLFQPRSIAVVGASSNENKAGHQMLRSLLGFSGALYGIHPREQRVLGRPCRPALTACEEPIDLAIVTVPASNVPAVLEDAAAAGVGAAVVCAGGFAESGEDGARLQAAIADIARAGDIRLLGPNTSGFVRPALGLRATFVPGAATLESGPVAIVAQSGGVHHALAFHAAREGAGVSLGVGLGNAVDISFVDVLRYIAEAGADTRVVALHVEGVARGRELAQAVAALTPRIPVVAAVVGRSDVSEFARSHTGALARQWALTRAALAQAGAVVVDDSTELIDAAVVLAQVRLPPSASCGVAVVTGQAGPGLLATDALRTRGVTVPEFSSDTQSALAQLLPPLTFMRNPVDTGRPSETFADVVATAAADTSIALTVVYALDEPGAVDPRQAVDLARARGHAVLYASAGPASAMAETRVALEAAGVPLMLTPERAAAAASALLSDSRSQHRGVTIGDDDGAVAVAGDVMLDEDAAMQLVEKAGFRCPRRIVCATRDDALAALTALRPPVVVKVCDAGIAHKTEAGGVHLGVHAPADLDAALAAIDAIARTDYARRYLIEEEAGPGVELILAARRDPSFGTVVALGLGGAAAEVFDDVALRLAPLDEQQAASMSGDLRGAALLAGHRGAPGATAGELGAAVRALASLLASSPEVNEIELNPIRITAEGLVVLDCLGTLSVAPQTLGPTDLRAPRDD